MLTILCGDQSRRGFSWAKAIAAGVAMLWLGSCWGLTGRTASAQTLTWDADASTSGPQDGSGTWSTTGTNWWNGSTVVAWPSPGTSGTAVLGAGVPGTYTVTTGTNITADRLVFDTGNYTVAGSGTLTIVGSGDRDLPDITMKTTSGTVTFAAPLRFTTATVTIGSIRTTGSSGGSTVAFTGGIDAAGRDIWLSGGNSGAIQPSYVFSGGTVNANSLLAAVWNRAGTDGGLVTFDGTVAASFNLLQANGDHARMFFKGNSVVTTGTLSTSLSSPRFYLQENSVLGTKQVNLTNLANNQFYFDGGTLRADASNANLLNLTSGQARVDAGGANINTNGFDVGISVNLLREGASTGGLTKQGLGTLTLTGTNAFVGSTTISAGALAINGTNALRDTSGVSIAGGAGLTYTGAATTFAKNVTVTPGSGTGTIRNTGGGLLTLSGTLSKDNSVLRLADGAFNVTGLITGTTPNASDLVVDAASVTLSNTNSYNGPTFVFNSGTLAVGIDNAIPNASVVTLGDATTQGTLALGGFTDSIAGLVFSGSGGTLSLSGDKTASAQLATSASLTLGSNASLVLTSAGTSAGLYRLISAPSITGSFGSVAGASAAYQVLTTATSVDYQQRAVLGALTVTSPTVSIITGGSAAFTYTVANDALSGGAALSFTGTGLSGVGGSSSGLVNAAGTSSAVTGLFFTGTSVGSGQTGTFELAAPTAFGATTATGTVSVNVLNHSLASFASTDTASLALDFGSYDNGTWTGGNGSLGFAVWNIASDGFLASDTAGLALYDIVFTSGSDIFGTNLATFADLAAGTSTSYTASVVSPGSLDQGAYQGVYTLRFRDQQNLSGAANTRDLTLTMNVVVVPEPGSIALSAIGVGLAGWVGHRRRRRESVRRL